MGNTYMPKPENRYPNNVSGFEHIWELDMLNIQRHLLRKIIFLNIFGIIILKSIIWLLLQEQQLEICYIVSSLNFLV